MKYKALMDGHECSEIMLNYVEKASNFLRLDSGFYAKEILYYTEKIGKMQSYKLYEALSLLTDYTANGSFASLAQNVDVEDIEGYAKWIRIQNLDQNDYENNIKYVNEKAYNFLNKSKLFGNELLLSKTGEYLGKAYIFNPEKEGKYTLADNIFLLKVKPGYSKPFLYTYINCKIGRSMLLKWSQGTGQPTVIKDSLKNLVVPKFSNEFVIKIEEVIKLKEKLFEQSRKIYNATEKEFMLRFNSVDFNSSSVTNIVMHSLIMKSSCRLDAEYYQPKYDKLFKFFKEIKTEKLGGKEGLVYIKKSIEPGSNAYNDSGIPFIRVSNVNKFGISEPSIKVQPEAIEKIESLFLRKDTILLSKDGSVGIAYRVEKDMECITSGALLHLIIKDKKKILPDYLTLVLNSKLVQLQAERDCNGAIIQHWKTSDIENVIIPMLDIVIQHEISNKIQEAFRLRRESKRLFDCAKQSVEMAIETDEKTAIEWLNAQLI